MFEPLHDAVPLWVNSNSELRIWVGSASELLAPLVQALGRYVFTAHKVHADDIPVRCFVRVTAAHDKGDCR